MAELRVQALKRATRFLPRPGAAQALRKINQKIVKRAARKGEVASLYDGDRLLAALLLYPSKFEQTGKPVLQITLDLVPGSALARRWLVQALVHRRERFRRGDIQLMVPSAYRVLLPFVERAGLHVDSVLQFGHPATALKALERRYGHLSWSETAGLRAVPIRTKTQVDQALRILKAEFTRNPQFGWFVSDAGHLKRERATLMKETRKSRPTYYVVERKGRVLGYFGTMLIPKHAIWGRSAGMTFCFDRSIQSQGVAKYAYATLLRRQVAFKARIFMGGTAQPGVLRLGRVMKREKFSYLVRNGRAHFPLEHFL